jgi:hypothetical protein
MNMLEGMFGPKKKKVIEAKDLPPQLKPFSSHDDMADDVYNRETEDYEAPPATEEQAHERYLEGELLTDARTPLPSQGSVEQVGMGRDAANQASYDRKIDNRRPWNEDKSWKAQRDTPYRPEA